MVAPIWEDNVQVFSWGYVLPTNFIDKMFFHEMIMVVSNRLQIMKIFIKLKRPLSK